MLQTRKVLQIELLLCIFRLLQDEIIEQEYLVIVRRIGVQFNEKTAISPVEVRSVSSHYSELLCHLFFLFLLLDCSLANITDAEMKSRVSSVIIAEKRERRVEGTKKCVLSLIEFGVGVYHLTDIVYELSLAAMVHVKFIIFLKDSY